MNPALKTIISYSIFVPLFSIIYIFFHKKIYGSYPLENLESLISWYFWGSVLLYLFFFSITLSVFRFTVLIPSFNQVKVIRKYLEGGVKDMWYTNYFDFDNLRRGEYKSYHSNGQLKEVKNYNHFSKRIGLFKTYDENGKIIKTIKYNSSTHILEEKTEYYENGNIKLEETYKEGKLNGVQKHYFENGNIKQKIEYDNGTLLGLYEDYYENGNLKSKYKNAWFVNHKIWKIVLSRKVCPDGNYEIFHNNGNLWVSGYYRNGKKYGHWTRIHENGNIQQELSYDSSFIKFYNENGDISFILKVLVGDKYQLFSGKQQQLVCEGKAHIYIGEDDEITLYKYGGEWTFFLNEYSRLKEQLRLRYKIDSAFLSNSENDPTSKEDNVVCPRCLGKGHVDTLDIKRLNKELYWAPGPCVYCDGSGKVDKLKLEIVSVDEAGLTTDLATEGNDNLMVKHLVWDE
jgi:antitoxin component YwqK of YwqJK toxin-antitoxin module